MCDTDVKSVPKGAEIVVPYSTRLLDISTNSQLFNMLKLENQPLDFINFLNISFCNITALPKDFFSSMKRLKILDLSFNKLTCLTSKMFSHLSNLEHLYILGNSEPLIIESYAFFGLVALRNLNLGQ